MKRIRIALALVAALALFAFAGCGVGNDESREDAGDIQTCVGGALENCNDRSVPSATAFNNHYPNVENKCDGHGHRIFVSTHDSATGNNVIVLPDPTCAGYVKGQEPQVVAGN